VALALMALYALGGSIPAWTVAGGISLLMAALCVAESLADEQGACAEE
jgi:small neutral amino acid transporter SnatA (MarC family)